MIIRQNIDLPHVFSPSFSRSSQKVQTMGFFCRWFVAKLGTTEIQYHNFFKVCGHNSKGFMDVMGLRSTNITAAHQESLLKIGIKWNKSQFHIIGPSQQLHHIPIFHVGNPASKAEVAFGDGVKKSSRTMVVSIHHPQIHHVYGW